MRLMKRAGVCTAIAAAVTMVLASVSYGSGSSSSFEESLLGSPPSPLPASFTKPDPPPVPEGSLFDKEVAVLTSQGISHARALQAMVVQSKAAQTDIVGKTAAGTDGAYGGVWFEPAAAQYHVGVTSSAGRRAAEGLIAKEGLTDSVVVTSVRSTMAQLVAVQKQWNSKLASLFAREEVMTGLEPQHNAVSVTLGSSVSVAERAALEREASSASANVLVTVGPTVFRPDAGECNNFAKPGWFVTANCELSITAGVGITLQGECTELPATETPGFPTLAACQTGLTASTGKWSRRAAGCSAGPVAVPEANSDERVLLTAGHCLTSNSEWYGFTRSLEYRKIGKTVEYMFGGPEKSEIGDYGYIKIEPAPAGGWQTGRPRVPVYAASAQWNRNENTRYQVKGERAPVVGNTDCREGANSGTSCGSIKKLNVATRFRNKFEEGLVVDTAISEQGDSGGPFLFEPTEPLGINPNHGVEMEGITSASSWECTEVATEQTGTEYYMSEPNCLTGPKEFSEKRGKWKANESNRIALFQPLRKLQVEGAMTPKGAFEALKLKLLTISNEEIPVAGKNEFEVEGKTIASGSKVEVTGQGVVLGQLEGEVAKTNIHISCDEAEGPAGASNVLESAGETKLKAELFGCTLYGVSGGKPENLPGCKIGEGGTIVAEADGETLTEAGLITYTGSQAGIETISTFEITEAQAKTACSLGDLEIEIKGKQTCGIPSYGFESTIGRLICDGAGSGELAMSKVGSGEPKNAKLYEILAIAGRKGQKLGEG